MDKFVPNKEDIKKMMEFNRLFVKTPCEKCGEPKWFDDLHLMADTLICTDCALTIFRRIITDPVTE